MRLKFGWILGLATALLAVGQASAAGLGVPEPLQLGLQAPATPVAESINQFHTFLLWLITLISLFVLGLLLAVIIKFNAKSNPEPSRTTHNTMIEVVWTVVPVLILIVVAIPSFRLLYLQRDFPDADMTIKATSSQWYWTYDYPDNGDINFDSVMKTREELTGDEQYLFAVDNPIVVPVNKTVRLIATSNDVIHAWTIPSFGSKIDAIPGRLNETWFKATIEGNYYGQCSELCGKDHAYMPIAVRVVSEAAFNT
ncbi:MAG: cytochrome c oxidase subunit II, partial [Hyphomicrobiales bacterium]|nr:cytochrome c oxidase subunit II [Hyphomicrobiales bacterium]